MKLHIGCGKKYLPGYKHLDAISYPHVDYVAEADRLSMFCDESLEEIYACHVLEHFSRRSIRNVLKEWNRCLIGGGILRIAVPDFEAIVREYISSGDLEQVMGLLYGGQDYNYNFHFQAYDFKRMEYLLTEAGFANVVRYEWKDFLPKDFDDFSRAYLPHMDLKKGRLMSLNILAIKQ